MAAPRRKISASERKGRDATMRVHNWVVVLVMRRLFDDGFSTSDVCLMYERLQREAGRIVLAHATPDWHWVDETQAADEVYKSVLRGGE